MIVKAYDQVLSLEKNLKETREISEHAEDAEMRQLAKQESLELEEKFQRKKRA